MKFYHGSPLKFDRFEATKESMAADNNLMQEGLGIYFTSSKKDAELYGKYVYEVEWKPKKLLPTKRQKISPFVLAKFAKASPDWKDAATNWDEEPEEGLQIAVASILESHDTPKEQFEQVWFDFYRRYPVEYVLNVVKLGYDGFIVDKKEGVIHAIVFNVDTLTIKKVNLLEAKKIDTGFSEIPKIIEYLKNKYSSVSIKEVEKTIKDHFKKVGKKIPKDDDFNTDLYGGITSAGLSIGGECVAKNNKRKVDEAIKTLQYISNKKVKLINV